MKFAKVIFAFFFSIFYLFGLIPRAISQKRVLEAIVSSQQVREHRCDQVNGQLCFLKGIAEDANTRIPPPPIAKKPTTQGHTVQGRTVRAVQSQFVVTYDSNFTPEARAAFQYEVDIWSSLIRTGVSIQIHANYIDYGDLIQFLANVWERERYFSHPKAYGTL